VATALHEQHAKRGANEAGRGEPSKVATALHEQHAKRGANEAGRGEPSKVATALHGGYFFIHIQLPVAAHPAQPGLTSWEHTSLEDLHYRSNKSELS